MCSSILLAISFHHKITALLIYSFYWWVFGIFHSEFTTKGASLVILYISFWFTNIHIYLNCEIAKSEIARPKDMLCSLFVESTIEFPDLIVSTYTPTSRVARWLGPSSIEQ